ncbi:unnamed protein product [Phaeothamnion confervicola]
MGEATVARPPRIPKDLDCDIAEQLDVLEPASAPAKKGKRKLSEEDKKAGRPGKARKRRASVPSDEAALARGEGAQGTSSSPLPRRQSSNGTTDALRRAREEAVEAIKKQQEQAVQKFRREDGRDKK